MLGIRVVRLPLQLQRGGSLCEPRTMMLVAVLHAPRCIEQDFAHNPWKDIEAQHFCLCSSSRMLPPGRLAYLVVPESCRGVGPWRVGCGVHLVELDLCTMQHMDDRTPYSCSAASTTIGQHRTGNEASKALSFLCAFQQPVGNQCPQGK